MYKFRLKLINCVLVTLLLPLAASGCARQSAAVDQAENVEISYTLDPTAARIGSAILVIKLTDEGGKPVEGAKLTFRGDMTHAGMSPVIADFREVNPGEYLAEIEWTMAGAWILTIKGDLADGRYFQRQIDLEVSP
ncbi:MAG: FixH family protein [Anaerolineales bacterium]